eukprot:scaffold3069_cov292-Pinguiococcus_pyrenoidosus.AAC.5
MASLLSKWQRSCASDWVFQSNTRHPLGRMSFSVEFLATHLPAAPTKGSPVTHVGLTGFEIRKTCHVASVMQKREDGFTNGVHSAIVFKNRGRIFNAQIHPCQSHTTRLQEIRPSSIQRFERCSPIHLYPRILRILDTKISSSSQSSRPPKLRAGRPLAQPPGYNVFALYLFFQAWELPTQARWWVFSDSLSRPVVRIWAASRHVVPRLTLGALRTSPQLLSAPRKRRE